MATLAGSDSVIPTPAENRQPYHATRSARVAADAPIESARLARILRTRSGLRPPRLA